MSRGRVQRNGPVGGSGIGGGPGQTNGPWNGIPNTGPSGGSSPPDSGNLLEWLKADAITGVTNGNPIPTWQHSVGSDATASGTARPTYILGGQNGKPVARFDGVANTMSTSTLGTPTTTSIALAFRYSGALNAVTSLASIGLSSILSTGGSTFINVGAGSMIATDNNFHIFFVFNTGSSTKWGFDGTALTTVAGAAGYSGALILGGGSGSFSQVDIAEVLVYSVDETSNYASIYNYLNSRWA